MTTPGATIEVRPTTEDNPNIITVVDHNGNTDLIKSENIDMNEYQNEPSLRTSTRARSTDPINRYGIPVTF